MQGSSGLRCPGSQAVQEGVGGRGPGVMRCGNGGSESVVRPIAASSATPPVKQSAGGRTGRAKRLSEWSPPRCRSPLAYLRGSARFGRPRCSAHGSFSRDESLRRPGRFVFASALPRRTRRRRPAMPWACGRSHELRVPGIINGEDLGLIEEGSWHSTVSLPR